MGEASYTCFSAAGNPQAELEWEVWAANGEPIEFTAEDVADDKRKFSHLTLTTTRSHKKINVLCISRNSAGTVEASIATDVIYLPENILLTGPSTLSQTESSSFYCSTDDSHPAATLHWSVLKYSENTKKSVSIDADSVETYETALKEGGVQTHSVLTLPPRSSVSEGYVNVTCQAENDPFLQDSITVGITGNVESSGDDESYAAASGKVDSLHDIDVMLEYPSGNHTTDYEDFNKILDYDTDGRIVSGLRKSESDEIESLEKKEEVEEDMVRLVPAEYTDEYEDDYVLKENDEVSRFRAKMKSKALEDDAVNEESIDSYSEDTILDATYKHTAIDVTYGEAKESNAADDETFNRAESEAAGVPLSLEGPSASKQHVDLSTFAESNSVACTLHWFSLTLPLIWLLKRI